MKRLLPALLAIASLLVGPSAWADSIDPLHGEVCGTGAAGCNTDNGSFAPIQLGAGGQLSNFGWSFSGPAGNNTGDLHIVILAPVGDGFVNTTITGTNISTPLLSSFVGTYTSGDLSTFLGLAPGSTSPANPFSGFQVGLNTGVTAFNVFDLTVPGILTLAGTGSPLADLFTTGNGLPAGLDLIAFLENTPGGNIATALSGQLQAQPFAAETPIPGALAMFAPVLLGGWYWLRRRVRSRNLSFA